MLVRIRVRQVGDHPFAGPNQDVALVGWLIDEIPRNTPSLTILEWGCMRRISSMGRELNGFWIRPRRNDVDGAGYEAAQRLHGTHRGLKRGQTSVKCKKATSLNQTRVGSGPLSR